MNELTPDEAWDKVDRFLRNNLDDTDYDEYSTALEVIRLDQSQAIPQWIACSERMPGDKQRVLVWDGEQLAIAVRFSGPPAFWGFNAFDFTEVTHWMPLPAAPTPQGENHE